MDVHIEAITVLNPADTEMPFVPSMPKNLVWSPQFPLSRENITAE